MISNWIIGLSNHTVI